MMGTDELIVSLCDKAAPIKRSPKPLGLFLQWLAVGVIYIALLLLHFEFRIDLMSKLHAPLFIAELALLSCVMITTALSAVTLSFPDMLQKRWLVFSPIIPVLLFAGVLYIEWLHDFPPAPKPPHGIDCLLCISLFSLIPTAWMLFILRKQASTHYYLAGAIALLAASSMGCIALRLSEDTDSVSHLVEWHYLPMLGFGVIGLWLGKRFLKW